MGLSRKSSNYFPGMYRKNRTTGSQIIENYFRQLDEKLIGSLKKKSKLKIPPCICFSRKIAIGALEIADILAERLNYVVVDRQIIEHMASNAELSQKTVEKFDERYPGRMNEFMNFLFGENSFIPSDYSRQLTQSVLALSGLQPSIFVGRGTHLILPRDRTFAVRLTGSIETRVKRLGKIINKDEEACRIELARQDSEQASFFKKMYGKKDAHSTEFDMVINRDYLENQEIIADIIEFAFRKKFKKEIPGGK